MIELKHELFPNQLIVKIPVGTFLLSVALLSEIISIIRTKQLGEEDSPKGMPVAEPHEGLRLTTQKNNNY